MVAAAEKVFDEIGTPIGGVPSHAVMAVWSKIEPMLKRVVRPQTGFDLLSVLNQLQLGYWQLWVVGDFEGVIVTNLDIRPKERVLWVRFMAGDNMNDWLDDWIVVQENYARHNGCTAIEFSGRKAWNRIHEQHREYKPILTTFRREL